MEIFCLCVARLIGDFSNYPARPLVTHFANEIGLPAHLVWLGGHVASEIALPEKGYVVVDPDTGVYWDKPLEEFGRGISCNEARHVLEERGFSPRLAKKFALAYCTLQHNKRSDYPYEPRLYAVERYTRYGSWVLPGFLLLPSILGVMRRRRAT